MTIAYGCILILIFFPYFFTVLAKTGPNFNNATPREYLAQLQGWRKRAHYVQLNSFEINPTFMTSAIIAHQLQAPLIWINTFAIGFVVTRIFYAIFYLNDKALLRSISWMVGFGCILALWVISIKHF